MIVQTLAQSLIANIGRVICGKDDKITFVVTALLAGGHVLLDDIPGTGKTSLAHVIAETTRAAFVELSAVTSGVSDIRLVIKDASERLKFQNQGTLLFIDEIHRFNKAQQDALLPSVEEGRITLIGATT